MRLVALSLVAGALMLAVAPAAEAKLCVGIVAPRTARAGDAVTIRVATFLPTWVGRTVVEREPARATFALRLILRGPEGAYRDVRLRPTPDPVLWSTRVRLRRPGTWTLGVSGWEHAPRSCAPPVRLRVT